jgi:hypothetical protein
MRLGAGVFPLGRQEWAAAMRAELFQIGDDGEAMHWALGCFFTGLRERYGLVALLNLRVVRWAIAAWIVYQVGGNLCSSLLVLSYKLRHLELTQFLSQWNEVKDYHSLVPLIDATAPWEPGLCLVAVALYLLGTVAVLRRSRSAYMLFVPALIADVGLWLYELNKPLFAEVYSPVELRHDTISYAVTALLVTALWQEMRSRQGLTS